jgi:subtilisin family serine protease
MSLHRPGQTRRRFFAGSMVIILAIAVLGLAGGNRAAAQLIDPRSLLEAVKKKGAEDPKKKLPGVLSGKKDATKAVVNPKNLPNLPGKGLPVNLGNNQPGKNLIGKATDTKSNVLSKGIDPKNTKGLVGNIGDSKTAIGKAGDLKNTKSTIGNLGDPKNAKGPLGNLGKGTDAKTALSKTTDLPKGNNIFGKGINPKGFNPKGVAPKQLLSGPLRGATPIARLQLRADHRRELLAARRLLPVRLLPGERGFTAVPPAGETRFRSTEMVFRVGPNVSPQALQAAMQRHGLTTIGSEDVGLAGGTVYHFQVAGGRPVPEVIRALEAESLGIPSANYTYQLFQNTSEQPAADEAANEADLAGRNEKGASEQYVVNKLQLAEVHKVATGRGVLVAVVDSAIDVNHPDLAGAFVEQYNAVGQQEKPHFHGTGMVGAIAAHRRLMGIAPETKILAIQAFSGTTRQTPEATTKQILAGLDWAVRKGARVINMSFAGPYDPLLALAMKNAHAKGVVLIAASGNLGPKSPPLYPAADPNVIAVTATDESDHLFAQAVRGPHVAVAAPGVDVMVPAPEATYQLTTGTSVAAAHVSGVAALLIERYPNVDAATILEVLTSTAHKLNPKGRDDQFGWGLIDPASALAELESRMSDNQIASASPPAQQAAAPKLAAPKQATQRQNAPRLAPASAQ